jgi:hypothetical protein
MTGAYDISRAILTTNKVNATLETDCHLNTHEYNVTETRETFRKDPSFFKVLHKHIATCSIVISNIGYMFHSFFDKWIFTLADNI